MPLKNNNIVDRIKQGKETNGSKLKKKKLFLNTFSIINIIYKS